MRRLVLIGLMSLSACGSRGADAALDSQACDALRLGPVENVTAAVSTGAGPKIKPSSKRYSIQLPDDLSAASRSGSVTIEQTQDGELLLFADSDVPMKLLNAFQEPRTLTTSLRQISCSKMQQKQSVELQRGTYFLKLGPTEKLHVGLVLLNRE